MKTARAALVLGATGGIGEAVTSALIRHGWRVRGMARKAQPDGEGIEWVMGDAMEREDVIAAARGVSVIVHAVNPPNYQNWDTLVLPMIDNTIAAARASGGARVVLPGTIYNFDPEATPVLRADSVQAPRSRKGKIRVALERRLQEAAPEVPSLIVRAGDYFGPGARSSWFSQVLVAPGKRVRRIIDPGRGGGHSWAYLPDLAEAFALLLDGQERLEPFERVQFAGVFDGDGQEMIAAIQRVCGAGARVFRFPWWAVRALSPFGGFMGEAAEIAPYWRHGVRLDNERLEALIGREPHTPLDEAVRAALIDMGCMAREGLEDLRGVAA